MTASSLTDPDGIVTIAVAGVALVALLGCGALTRAVGRLRRAQRVVLGEHEQRDIVAHGAAIQEAVDSLKGYIGDVADRLNERLEWAELGLQGAIAHRALVRYDAWNELSGRQSMSIALLDGTHSGIVLTCIHHRDQARVYAKQVHGGRSDLELSPEEAEAVRVALTAPPSASASDLSTPRDASSAPTPRDASSAPTPSDASGAATA